MLYWALGFLGHCDYRGGFGIRRSRNRCRGYRQNSLLHLSDHLPRDVDHGVGGTRPNPNLKLMKEW